MLLGNQTTNTLARTDATEQYDFSVGLTPDLRLENLKTAMNLFVFLRASRKTAQTIRILPAEVLLDLALRLDIRNAMFVVLQIAYSHFMFKKMCVMFDSLSP